MLYLRTLKKKEKLILFFIISSLFLLNLIILFMRYTSLIEYGDINFTSGVEGPGIFNIWKVINNYQLYTDPNKFPFNIAIYNYLFYYFYGYSLKLFEFNSTDIMIWGRIITFSFSIVGYYFHSKLLLFITNTRNYSYQFFFIILLTFLLWFGTGSTSWWVLTIRPDIPAAALTITGLYLFITKYEKSLIYLFYSSILFYFAWSFKQSYISVYIGILLFLFLKFHFSKLIMFTVPFISLCIITIYIGGNQYISNLLATSGHQLYINILADNFFQTLALNPFFWGFFPFVIIIRSSFKKQFKLSNITNNELLFIILAITTLLFTAIFASKIGSSKNHFFESFLIFGSLSIYYLIEFFDIKQLNRTYKYKVTFTIITILILSQFILPLLQITYPNKYGKQQLIVKNEFIKLNNFYEFIETLPKPIFSNDNIIALPWNAGTDITNSAVLDYPHYFISLSKGNYKEENLTEIVLNNEFKTIIFRPVDNLENIYELGLLNGYYEVDIPVSIDLYGNNKILTIKKED